MTELQTILARLDHLEARNRALEAEVSELRASAPVPPSGAAPAEAAGPVSRRALLGAGIGAVAATVAATVARPSSVSANDPNDVRLGADNVNVTQRTLIATTSTSKADAIIGVAYSDATGIVGQSTEGAGVVGYSGSGAPPRLLSHVGVYGQDRRGDGAGVSGDGGAVGVAARSQSTGVQAYGRERYGVFAQSLTGVGVQGKSESGPGVIGESDQARGGVFKSKVAQLRLAPAAAANHPATGARGDLFVDKSGRLWYCKGTTTWVQLA